MHFVAIVRVLSSLWQLRVPIYIVVKVKVSHFNYRIVAILTKSFREMFLD